MNRNLVKLFSFFMIVAILTSAIMPVFAAGTMLQPSSISPDYSSANTTGMTSIAGKVIGLIRNVAVIAGVVILSFLGIKYMLGSIEEKAKYKETLMPLIVGIIVVMSATQIATMIFSFFNENKAS